VTFFRSEERFFLVAGVVIGFILGCLVMLIWGGCR
jgi:hypothetical protein